MRINNKIQNIILFIGEISMLLSVMYSIIIIPFLWIILISFLWNNINIGVISTIIVGGITIWLGNKSLKKTSNKQIKIVDKKIEEISEEQIKILKEISKKQIEIFNKHSLTDSYIRIRNFVAVVRGIEEDENSINGEHIKRFIGNIIAKKDIDMAILSGWGCSLADEFNKEGSSYWVCFKMAEYFRKIEMGEAVSLSFDPIEPFLKYFKWEVIDNKNESEFFYPIKQLEDRVEVNYHNRKIWINNNIKQEFIRIAGEYLSLIKIIAVDGNLKSYEAGTVWNIFLEIFHHKKIFYRRLHGELIGEIFLNLNMQLLMQKFKLERVVVQDLHLHKAKVKEYLILYREN